MKRNVATSEINLDSIRLRHLSTSSLYRIELDDDVNGGKDVVWLSYGQMDALIDLIQELCVED